MTIIYEHNIRNIFNEPIDFLTDSLNNVNILKIEFSKIKKPFLYVKKDILCKRIDLYYDIIEEDDNGLIYTWKTSDCNDYVHSPDNNLKKEDWIKSKVYFDKENNTITKVIDSAIFILTKIQKEK